MTAGEAPALPELRETGCHFLWKVEKGGGTAYLLGSLHALPEGFYPLPEPVMEAWAASAALALEVYEEDPLKAMAGQQKMMESGKYPEGETLKDHLPEALWVRLRDFCKARELPFKKMQEYRPFCVASFVEHRELSGAQAGEQAGLENFFAPKAQKEGKPIRALEPAEGHFRAPFGGTPEEDAALIEQVISEHAAIAMKDLLDWTLRAWRLGDAEGFHAHAVAGQEARYPGLKSYFQRMVRDRNAVMADAIGGFVGKGETVFCLAGMMHCGGEDGVPALLRKRGFTVTQVGKKPAP